LKPRQMPAAAKSAAPWLVRLRMDGIETALFLGNGRAEGSKEVATDVRTRSCVDGTQGMRCFGPAKCRSIAADCHDAVVAGDAL